MVFDNLAVDLPVLLVHAKRFRQNIVRVYKYSLTVYQAMIFEHELALLGARPTSSWRLRLNAYLSLRRHGGSCLGACVRRYFGLFKWHLSFIYLDLDLFLGLNKRPSEAIHKVISEAATRHVDDARETTVWIGFGLCHSVG